VDSEVLFFEMREKIYSQRRQRARFENSIRCGIAPSESSSAVALLQIF
jgi:hypothetical protein